MAALSANVVLTGDPDDWIAVAWDAETHAFGGEAAILNGAFSITGLTAGRAYMVACRPKSGPAWTPSTVKNPGSLVIPSNPIATPNVYKASASDSLASSVSLLLHCNGTNGSKTFTDDTGKTMTANGTASIDTGQSKFGGASGYFNGGYVTTPNNAGFVFGSGGFCIECFFRWSGNTSSLQYLISRYDTGVNARIFAIIVDIGGAPRLRMLCSSTGTSANFEIMGTTTLTANTWYHAAFVRNGNTLKLYLNGNLEGTTGITAALYESANTVLAIGAQSSGGFQFFGNIDEVRITKAGRYADGCTPPTAEFILSRTGATEPVWPANTGDTITDAGVIWENMGRLVRPLIHGPAIAA